MLSFTVFAFTALLVCSVANAFVASTSPPSKNQRLSTARFNSYLDTLELGGAAGDSDDKAMKQNPTPSTKTNVSEPTVNPEITRLKDELIDLAKATKRGFASSSSDRTRANKLIDALASYNPTTEPAAPYYKTAKSTSQPTLAGKWTLVYTDAPDITSLASTPTAKLGRIGQDCTPPFIKNVIEWKRPDWAASLPFSGSESSRILQKVVTQATASPDNPCKLTLELAGIELSSDGGMESSDPWKAIQENGLSAGLLQINPIDLKGPIQTYFGTCTIVYLDEELRIIRTGQNFLAVNRRDQEPWF
jgi:PAP_fibrillin